MRISNKGMEFIKRREGTVRDENGMHRPYEDSAGQLQTLEYLRMSSVCSDIEGSL